MTLLFGAYFLALLETWTVLFLHTKSLSVQEPRGRSSSSKSHFLFLVFLLCHQIPGKEIQISDALITHFTVVCFFFFFCSWFHVGKNNHFMLVKKGGSPNFPSLYWFCGLFWTQAQQQLRLGEPGVTHVPCFRWDSWVTLSFGNVREHWEGRRNLY